MPTFYAKVLVATRSNVLHPQSKTVQDALHGLGFGSVNHLQMGKHFSFTLNATDEATARNLIVQMAEQLLANPVIEDTHICELNCLESL